MESKKRMTQKDLDNYKEKIRVYFDEHGDDSTYWKMVHQYTRMKVELILQPIKDNIGNYLSLYGKPSFKQDVFQIMGITEDGDVKLRAYRGRKIYLMRSYTIYEQSQHCHILTVKEFKKLPVK